MPDYRKMYYELAARVADAIDLLYEAQHRGEEAAMDDDDPPLVLPPEELAANKDGPGV